MNGRAELLGCHVWQEVVTPEVAQTGQGLVEEVTVPLTGHQIGVSVCGR